MHVNNLVASCLVPAVLGQAFIQQKLDNGEPSGTVFGEAGANQTFDYVIVGGGTAGSVVAARLAEDPTVSVAVIEPGTFYETTNGNNSQVPYYSLKYIDSEPSDYQPLIDWGLTTEPQAGANGMRIHYAQGKCLGGSSGRNQMYFHRGTPGAYQVWADRVGDDSYLWDNYFKFFQRSTRFTEPSVNAPLRAENATPQYNMSSFGANDGPLQLSYPNHANPFSSYLPKAFEEALGLPAIDAFTSGNLNGHGYNTFTFNPFTGLRSSSETAFLSSAMRNASNQRRSNIQVFTLSRATQILFDSNKTATGVKVNSMGAHYTLSARNEVILSAGPWHSPQLLMLSGVGPRNTLEQHNIKVLSDRPGVGQGMWDSTNLGGVSQRVAIPTTSELNTPEGMAQNVELFNANRTGFLATSGGDYIGWYKFPQVVVSTMSQAAQDHINSFPADWPDIEYVISSEAGQITSSDTTIYAANVGIDLIASASRGNMTISSNDINDPPVISPNWFLSPIDHEIAVAAVRQARKIWAAIPQEIRVGDELQPGADKQTDEEITEALASSIAPIHHASASCKMGRNNDTEAVVDSKGRVIGVQSLRVIDSSSLPFTPPGHTQGYTYAHAEKLVDDIKMGH